MVVDTTAKKNKAEKCLSQKRLARFEEGGGGGRGGDGEHKNIVKAKAKVH